MLEFPVWRELAESYVRTQARLLGWSVERCQQSKSSRSVYLYLTKDRRTVTVRLSDHRSMKLRRSCFSVAQCACGRLADLARFLVEGRYVPAHAVASTPEQSGVSILAGEAGARFR